MFQGRGFESQTYTGWTFFTYISCKNSNDVCLKRLKINDKEAGVGPFFLKKTHLVYQLISVYKSDDQWTCCKLSTTKRL